jgi:5-methylcytosine-specific restriction endonuclease McrBC GTP-binding regulatory subunit McrB
LILDEMNLSHVERYFADVLSAIESDEVMCLHQDSGRSFGGQEIPSEIALPRNLFIIGTVNVDETTYMFSPKVLDRANVIEFRMEATELEVFLASPERPDLSKLDGKGEVFGRSFVSATNDDVAVPDDVSKQFEEEMLLFFRVMQAHGAEFGYRVAHESARFTHYYKLLGSYSDGVDWFSGAFDCVIVQKILPKLHGSRTKLGPLLKILWFLCVTSEPTRGEDPLNSAMEASRSTDKNAEPSTLIPPDAPYPMSAEKIARMWRMLRDNGFTSFAEA